MKIILSRKGFDSSAGGHASPILSDATMVSLPIPSPLDDLAYEDIALARPLRLSSTSLGAPASSLVAPIAMRGRRSRYGNGAPTTHRVGSNYADLIRALDAGARLDGGAHLDPDLRAAARPRRAGWQPTFGQIGAAGGHLRNARVGVGDVFLFFGWFRHAELSTHSAASGAGGSGTGTRRVRNRPLARIRDDRSCDGTRLRFVRDPGVHALFGYLEVGAVIDGTGTAPLPSWLADHPHAHPRRRAAPNNTLYVAAATLTADRTLPGAGVFRFDEALVLTKPGEARSRWCLDPAVFGDVAISHHGPDAWRDGAFQSCRRGQEFVIETTARVREWALHAIRTGMTAGDRNTQN